jgi:hypothetical protein
MAATSFQDLLKRPTTNAAESSVERAKAVAAAQAAFNSERDTRFATLPGSKPLGGPEAFAAFTSTLRPKVDSRELWIKVGHTDFYHATWGDNGELTLHPTQLTNPKDPTSRTINKTSTRDLNWLLCRSREVDGGLFFIPTQPQGLPLASHVAATDTLSAEIDQGTTEEQWALYQSFSHVTGLEWALLITSGSKSIHGHIKADQHLDLEQAQYVRRLMVIAMQSDPVTVRLHQPMRLPGGYRREKQSEQALLSYSQESYSYDRLVAAFRAWFEFKGLKFPDRITDSWWSEFHTVLKGCAQHGESERFGKCKALLEVGLEGFEAQIAAEQAEREERAAAARAKRESYVGSTKQPSEQIKEACAILGAAAFDDSIHNWVYGAQHKARGCCSFHQSSSGNSAWIAPLKDGHGWGFHCSPCNNDKPINGFKYWLYSQKGWGAAYPRGAAYIDAAREFLSHHGFTMEELPKAAKSKRTQNVSDDATEKQDPCTDGWDGLGEHDLELGKWEGGNGKQSLPKFKPLLGCTFTITNELTTSTESFLELLVKWKAGPVAREKLILMPVTDCAKVDSFKATLNAELGAFIACVMTSKDLQGLIRNRLDWYHNAGGRRSKLAEVFGCQPDGYFVFENIQFDPSGAECSSDESGWVFNPRLGQEDGMSCPVIHPQNLEALPNLVTAGKAFYHPKTWPFVLTELGYGTATLHRDKVFEVYGEFAQSTIDGEGGCGKSKAAKMAASVAGMHQRELVMGVNTTESALAQRIHLYSGILTVHDDPIPLGGDQKEIKQARKSVNATTSRLFNGFGRGKRGGAQAANTNIVVTTNCGVGGTAAAQDERIIIKNYPNHPVNVANGEGDRLDRAMDSASGGLGQLLQIKFDRDRIDSYAVQLLRHMPNAHARQARSLAIQVYFTEQFCEVAGVADFDAFAFTRDVLCPQADATETAKPNLTDFLERIDNLRTDGHIGPWNVAMVRKDHQRYLAIRSGDLWEALQRHQSANLPNYGPSAIKSQIIEKGGDADSKTRQKFVATRQDWQEFLRQESVFKINMDEDSALRGPIAPKRDKSWGCWLIPERVVEEALGRPWGAVGESDDPAEAKVTGATLLEGDLVIVSQDTDEGLKQGQIVTIERIESAQTPTGPEPYAVLQSQEGRPLTSSNGNRCTAWLTLLRRATEADRPGAWEVAA